MSVSNIPGRPAGINPVTHFPRPDKGQISAVRKATAPVRPSLVRAGDRIAWLTVLEAPLPATHGNPCLCVWHEPCPRDQETGGYLPRRGQAECRELARTQITDRPDIRWHALCECDCGRVVLVTIGGYGQPLSCGCHYGMSPGHWYRDYMRGVRHAA